VNVDAAGRFDPAHLEKWCKVTRAYLAGPLAELRSDDAVKEATRHPAPQVRCDWSGCYLAPWAWLIALGCIGLPVTSSAAEPLALRGIMKEMGRNMQTIVDGLSREDYAVVEKAALAIADHPQPPMGEKMRIMGFVGGDTPRFKVFDGETHDNATALAKAAKNGKGEEAITVFHKLQSSCLACHQAFRKPFQEHFYGKAEVRQ